jgi:magnesium chelatase family protein
MIARVLSATLHGFKGRTIEVEADIKQGLPGIQVIGMGDKAVSEARERVRSALQQSHLPLPARKFTISLAPADIRKDGAQFDLALAVALLVASGALKQHEIASAYFIGELSLDGTLKPVRGVINIALLAKDASADLYIPAGNAQQAALVEGARAYPVTSLVELFLHLKGEKRMNPIRYTAGTTENNNKDPFENILGHTAAKRALTIAAAGRHNILLFGSPGSGKTLLAAAIAELLPPLTNEQQLTATAIHSLARQEAVTTLLTRPPYRAPHHTIGVSALIGGGISVRPGEISLAHSGVLHLDELPEFSRQALEGLRQPIESGKITISRHQQTATYPASFLLVATMNPCPCGYYGDPDKTCACSESQRLNYQRRISGPLFDRFDIVVRINRVHSNEFYRTHLLRSKQQFDLLNDVARVTSLQYARTISSNYNNVHDIEDSAVRLLRDAADSLHFSTRTHFKILRVARTIADLEASLTVSTEHIAEALQLRPPSAEF